MNTGAAGGALAWEASAPEFDLLICGVPGCATPVTEADCAFLGRPGFRLRRTLAAVNGSSSGMSIAYQSGGDPIGASSPPRTAPRREARPRRAALYSPRIGGTPQTSVSPHRGTRGSDTGRNGASCCACRRLLVSG